MVALPVPSHWDGAWPPSSGMPRSSRPSAHQGTGFGLGAFLSRSRRCWATVLRAMPMKRWPGRWAPISARDPRYARPFRGNLRWGWTFLRGFSMVAGDERRRASGPQNTDRESFPCPASGDGRESATVVGGCGGAVAGVGRGDAGFGNNRNCTEHDFNRLEGVGDGVSGPSLGVASSASYPTSGCWAIEVVGISWADGGLGVLGGSDDPW